MHIFQDSIPKLSTTEVQVTLKKSLLTENQATPQLKEFKKYQFLATEMASLWNICSILKNESAVSDKHNWCVWLKGRVFSNVIRLFIGENDCSMTEMYEWRTKDSWNKCCYFAIIWLIILKYFEGWMVAPIEICHNTFMLVKGSF